MKFRKSTCPCLDFKIEKKLEETLYFLNMVLKGIMDDTVKGGLTQFYELFTLIPCAPKDFKR